MTADEYQHRIQPARDAVRALRAEFFFDLDEDNGGFGWWKGFTDGRRTAIASDYLIAAADGVISGLNSSPLATTIFGEVATTDEFRLQQKMQAPAKAGLEDAAAMQAYVNPDARTQRRLTEGRDAAEHAIATSYRSPIAWRPLSSASALSAKTYSGRVGAYLLPPGTRGLRPGPKFACEEAAGS